MKISHHFATTVLYHNLEIHFSSALQFWRHVYFTAALSDVILFYKVKCFKISLFRYIVVSRRKYKFNNKEFVFDK